MFDLSESTVNAVVRGVDLLRILEGELLYVKLTRQHFYVGRSEMNIPPKFFYVNLLLILILCSDNLYDTPPVPPWGCSGWVLRRLRWSLGSPYLFYNN